MHVIACLAEGLGIRGTARVFEVDPNTVLHWLVEAADNLRTFSQYFLHDVRVTQVQLDELFALLSAVRTSEVSGSGAKLAFGGKMRKSVLGKSTTCESQLSCLR